MRRRRIASLGLLIALPPAVLTAAAPAFAQPSAPAFAQPSAPAFAQPAVTASVGVAAVSPSKIPTLLSSRAAQIAALVAASPTRSLTTAQADEVSADVLSIDTAGGIEVQVHAAAPVTAAQLGQLQAAGASVVAGATGFTPVPGMTLPTTGLVSAVVPYDKLQAVAALPWVTVLRPSMRPATDVGPVEAESVRLHNAGRAQHNGFTGAGEKVGAISGDVDNIAYSIDQGELPADVQVLQTTKRYEDDEGTAMLEIVHDMAPDADLAFASTGRSLYDYVEAFHTLAAAGSTLITEDIALDDEPAFQQGIGARTAEDLAKYGIGVSSSAGNLATRHAPRVTAKGTGEGPDGVSGPYSKCPSKPDNVVNLLGSDSTFDISLSANAQFNVTLQWSEPRAIYPTEGQGGFTDLNLYLMDEAGTTCLDYSDAVQANGVGDTIEQALYTNKSGATQRVKLVVDVQDTSSAVKAPILDLRWRAYTSGVTNVDAAERAGSLNPDSNYLGYATSAAAVDVTSLVKPKEVPLESYSAAGPVQVVSTTRCPDSSPGPCIGVSGTKLKTMPAPTWSASDGVSVSGAGGFGSGTCPTDETGRCRFYGTSAAAPSATGVAALIRQEFGGDISPVELNKIMIDRAQHRDGDGFGAGVLRAALRGQ